MNRLLREVAERVRAQEMLARAARSDPLTALMNRRGMLEHLEYQAARFQRSHATFTVMLADLDHFKEINDSHGHDVGDQVLVQFARRLTDSIRSQDLVARWGGEEFLILCRTRIWRRLVIRRRSERASPRKPSCRSRTTCTSR